MASLPDRTLDDYASITLKFENKSIIGNIISSILSHGQLNKLTVEVDYSEGSILWEDPDKLYLRKNGIDYSFLIFFVYFKFFYLFFLLTLMLFLIGEPLQILTAGASYNQNIPTRLPAAHPEGMSERNATTHTSLPTMISPFPLRIHEISKSLTTIL